MRERIYVEKTVDKKILFILHLSLKYKSKIRKNYLSKFDFVFNHKVLIFTILFALVILCPIIVGLLEWPIIISKIVGYSIIGFICLFFMACVFY